MRTFLITGAALAASWAATGIAAAPDIAFAKGGTRGDAVYVVDADGTGLTKVYQGQTTSRLGAPIERIAIRSRSGGESEVAFIENYRTVKVQRLDSNRQPIGTPSAITVDGEPDCVRSDLDYLSDGTLLVATCTNIWAVAPDAASAGSSPAAVAASSINSLAGVGTAILYTDGSQLKFKDSSGTSILRSLSDPYLRLDASSTLAVASDKDRFQTVGLTDPYPANPGCTAGGFVELSPDGSQILYLYRGWMFVHSVTCSGSPFRVAKGPRSMAWRTY